VKFSVGSAHTNNTEQLHFSSVCTVKISVGSAHTNSAEQLHCSKVCAL